MSNITVLMFETVDGAETMLTNVYDWEKAGLITVEDAVVVIRPPGNSNFEIKQTRKQSGKYALGGGGIGLLAGMLLGGPIGGLAVGAAIGGITGAMKDYGIDDEFVRQISEGLRPSTSALFLMTSDGKGEELMAELRPHKATVVSTTLEPDQEARLRKALKDEG